MTDPAGTDTDDLSPAIPFRRRLIAAVVLAAVAGAAVVLPGTRTPLLLIAALVVLVVVHEAGHFVAARATGMKPTEFFVGFGPRLWSTHRNGTEFGVKAIPAGGYVRIPGMSTAEDIPADLEPFTYRAATAPRRLLVVSAGVLVNLVVGFMLFTVAFTGSGEQVVGTSTQIAAVDGGSPADMAGVRAGDTVVALNGVELQNWADIGVFLNTNPDQDVVVTVLREGAEQNLSITPKTSDGVTRIGVQAELLVEPISAGDATAMSARTIKDITVGSITGLAKLVTPSGMSGYVANFTGAATETQQLERPRSLVGIIDVGSEASSEGLWALLFFVGAISVALAVFNALPILPLDGGHMVVAAYEGVMSRIRHRRVFASAVWLGRIGLTAIALLIALALSAVVLDIADLAQG